MPPPAILYRGRISSASSHVDDDRRVEHRHIGAAFLDIVGLDI